ncbi:DnaJ-domain-containing protein [Rhizodiscina lignyota]|uniref:DnaJ-domain-containing protein n=1 Tax=Rhizodiscina lignyota TaxID=1504668 RepID=A0A9P4INU8_9PEZI|nr:DnaJ-domain-containing protein [Rhizodiscina lignyota]
MPSDELKEYATSQVDFYELLGVSPASNESEIRRAYRRTALKYHPDKNKDNPSAIEKFHLLQIANDVLSDAEVRSLYDNARTAREAKRRQHELFEGKRRQMKEDLERRETGAKRKRDEMEDEQEKLEREIRRLAEDGKRRRKEREEMLSREKLEEQVKADEAQTQTSVKSYSNVSELDRSVKIRWAKEGDGESIDKERLSSLFSQFGEIDSVFLLKDKKKKVNGKKKMMATGVVVFKSIVGAHAAISDMDKFKAEKPWALFEVNWANEQEPNLERPSTPQTPQTPQTPPSFGRKSFPGVGSLPNTPIASYSPGLSLEEATLIRLKNAEKKRLEEQIRKQEAAEQEQEAA